MGEEIPLRVVSWTCRQGLSGPVSQTDGAVRQTPEKGRDGGPLHGHTLWVGYPVPRRPCQWGVGGRYGRREGIEPLFSRRKRGFLTRKNFPLRLTSGKTVLYYQGFGGVTGRRYSRSHCYCLRFLPGHEKGVCYEGFPEPTEGVVGVRACCARCIKCVGRFDDPSALRA